MVDRVSIKSAIALQLRGIQYAGTAKETAQNLATNAPQQASLPKLIQMAAELAGQGTPIDYAKIAQVRRAIANGDYKIDPGQIANAMIRFHTKSES